MRVKYHINYIILNGYTDRCERGIEEMQVPPTNNGGCPQILEAGSDQAGRLMPSFFSL
jgi:hypothetical protein